MGVYPLINRSTIHPLIIVTIHSLWNSATVTRKPQSFLLCLCVLRVFAVNNY